MAGFGLMETSERKDQMLPLFQVQKLNLSHGASAQMNQRACLFWECQLLWAGSPGMSLYLWIMRLFKATVYFLNIARDDIVKEQREARLPA